MVSRRPNSRTYRLGRDHRVDVEILGLLHEPRAETRSQHAPLRSTAMAGYHPAIWAARAMRGTITVGSLASNYSYNSLYNTSSGAEVLIVRLLASLSAGVTFFGVQFVAGQYGVVAGKVTR